MKEEYLEPELEFIEMEANNAIETSSESAGVNPGQSGGDNF